MVIGLDVSTSAAGLAIAENKTIIDAVSIDISKESTYDGKANLIIKQIDAWLLLYKPTTLNIEEALNSFAFGKTNAQTIVKLIRNSAVLEYILRKHYPQLIINLINVTTARKKLFGKSRVKGIKPKPFVKMMLELSNPEVKQFYLPMKSKRCKNENTLNEDLRDASIMAIFNE